MSQCAVCLKKVHAGLLMCATHWRLVPIDLQEDVYRTHAVLQRTSISDRAAWSTSIAGYRAARDAAVAVASNPARQTTPFVAETGPAQPHQGALL